VALRGIAGPVPNGHFASSAAIGMGADNMWRWHILLPLVGYHAHFAGTASAYMHHPLGVFWDMALLGKIFGFSDWVVRLPPVLYVTATPYFLWRIGREIWGPIEGGLCALAYVALPITIGYANYHDLEQPYILGAVASTWGYLRFVRTWRGRYAAVSVFGFFFAIYHAWLGYIWGAFFVSWLFVWGFVLPERLVGPLHARAFGRYWALMLGAAAAGLGVELALLVDSGRMADLMGSFSVRRGDLMTLQGLLDARKYRNDLMFTGLGIGIGKLGLAVVVARVLIKRRALEILPIPLFLAGVVHFVLFKQGAYVHIFWPHPFAPYFALAVGAIAASVREGLVWIAPRLPRRLAPLARHAALAALVMVGVPVLFILRDGLSLMRLSRESGGRFAEANLESEIDKAIALRWFLARIPGTAGVAFHPSFPNLWNLMWEARPREIWSDQAVSAPPAPGARAYVLDSRSASPADLHAMVSRFHVYAVGPFWFVDRSEPPAPIDGYSLDEREPNWMERWSQGDVEPVRSVRADPWITWEWRTSLGQVARVPGVAPSTTDDLRIAHNAAVAAGDASTAAALESTLRSRLNLPLTASYANGTELLGAIHGRGAQHEITFYFLSGRFDRDAHFAVIARVVAPPVLSTLPVDPASLDLARSPVLPTSLWRPGHIYAIRVVYRKRPGTELLTGAWSPGPPQTGRRDPLEIARIR
jgi:hypothetical protein